MEKKIILKIQPSKDIEVFVNGDKKLTIGKASRRVKADDIYHLLDYSIGDTFTVESVNEGNIDKPVLGFFADLLNDISVGVNRIVTDGIVDDDSSVEQEIDSNTPVF